ncbi:MAG: hypothetical protein OXC03_01500 [Flavobacteriaceae bacterium]|nr:hypothetical protein [Flavobacteriaceae bacterium]
MSVLDKRDFNDFDDDNSELVSLEVPLVDLQRLNEMVERFNFEIAKKPIGIRSSRDRDLVGLSFEIIRGYIDIVNQGLK